MVFRGLFADHGVDRVTCLDAAQGGTEVVTGTTGYTNVTVKQH